MIADLFELGLGRVDVEVVRVTKGAFFYHFDSKADLALALVERFASQDGAVLDQAMVVARSADDDPREQVLALVSWMEEQFGALEEPYPGCLFASYLGEAGLFDDDTLDVARQAIRRWRVELGGLLREAAAVHPPRLVVDLDSLADQLTVVFEGAFLLSKTYGRADVTAEQVSHYRRYLELLFPAD